MKTDLGFWSLLKEYLEDGKRQLFTLREIIVCGFLSCLVAAIIGFYTADVAAATKEISSLLFSAAAGLLGVVLAGFAISAAVTDAGFSAFLYKHKKLIPLLSPFWFSSALWGLTLAVTGLAYASSLVLFLKAWLPLSCFLAVLTFALSLSFTLSLVGNTLNTGYYRAMYHATAPSTDNDQEQT